MSYKNPAVNFDPSEIFTHGERHLFISVQTVREVFM